MDFNEVQRFTRSCAGDIQPLIEGVANCLHFGGLQPQESLLILAETNIDPRVVKAFEETANAFGAEVCVLTMAPVWPPREASSMATSAMQGADLCIGLINYPSIWRNIGAIKAMKLHETRYVSLATMCSYETLTSDAAKWPMEIYWKLVERMETLASGVKQIRVTNPRGTDITAAFDPIYAKLGVSRGAFQKGSMTVFPLGDSRMYPTLPDYETFQPTPSGDGVIVFDGFYEFGLLEEPVRMTVEKGWVRDIDGGREAQQIKAYLDRYPNSYHFNEISWGHNPCMPLQLWDKMLIQANRASSVVHLGLGDARMDGGTIASPIKPAGSILYRPSLFMDGTPVVLDGRLMLLDDPEVVAVAEGTGDPHRWLTEQEVYEG